MSQAGTSGSRHRIFISFRMFSPYIMARLNAAADVAEVVAVEGSHRTSTYAWEPRAGEERFLRETMYTDQPIEDVPADRIWADTQRVLDRHQPDIVALGGWNFAEALAALDWAVTNRRPRIMFSESTAHDAPRSWWREWPKARIVASCQAAMVGGQDHVDYLARLGFDPARVTIGYNAVDNDYFARGAEAVRQNATDVRARQGLPDRFFLASCRFIPIKNLVRLLDAYALYRDGSNGKPWNLVIIGDGEQRPVLEARISELGLDRSVTLPGFRQIEELPDFYGLAGAFVHVSLIEPWGLVVNEAQASGLPVIASDRCGCTRELIRDGINGFAVDPTDTSGIADRMQRIAADPQLRDRMTAGARTSVADYGPARFADGLDRAIRIAEAAPLTGNNPVDRWIRRRVGLR